MSCLYVFSKLNSTIYFPGSEPGLIVVFFYQTGYRPDMTNPQLNSLSLSFKEKGFSAMTGCKLNETFDAPLHLTFTISQPQIIFHLSFTLTSQSFCFQLNLTVPYPYCSCCSTCGSYRKNLLKTHWEWTFKMFGCDHYPRVCSVIQHQPCVRRVGCIYKAVQVTYVGAIAAWVSLHKNEIEQPQTPCVAD